MQPAANSQLDHKHASPADASTANASGAALSPSLTSRIAPTPKRILIKAVNWLGDLVMSLPAMRAVRRACPDAHLAVLVKKELGGFFDGATWIDEVIPYSVGSGFTGLNDRFKIVAEIRARHFDLAVLMPNSFQSALWVTAAGIPRRAGYSLDRRGAMLTHKTTPTRAALEGHQSLYWLAMVRETLGIEGAADDLALTPAAAHVATMRDWLKTRRRHLDAPLIAIAPAAAYGPAKEWPAEKFAAVIDALAQKAGAECVLIGAPSERAKCAQVAAMTSSGAIVSAGETSIGELIALLSLSSAFIGNDSGCMHLAGALKIPTVALFGSTNPIRTGPAKGASRVIWHHLECSPCLARTCRFGHYNCLREIEPQETLEALKSLGMGSLQ
jgi:heptosyltransferase-2